MRRKALLALLMYAALLAACGGGGRAPAADDRGSEPVILRGVYAGTFPCGNCAGIAVRLWLRDDGVFFMREDFLAAEGAGTDRVHALGRWHWDSGESLLILSGRGPERRYAYTEPGRLEMLTFSGQPHILDREPDGSSFTDRVRLEGEYVSDAGNESFRECITGLKLPLRDDRGRRVLRTRHRNITKPAIPALASVDAHLVYEGPTELLAVEELLWMRPGTVCE